MYYDLNFLLLHVLFFTFAVFRSIGACCGHRLVQVTGSQNHKEKGAQKQVQAHSTQYFAGRTMASGQYNNETVAEQTTLLNVYFSM